MRAPRDEHMEEFLREIAACGVSWKRLPAVERALNTYLLAASTPRTTDEAVGEVAFDFKGDVIGLLHFPADSCDELPVGTKLYAAPRPMAAQPAAHYEVTIHDIGILAPAEGQSQFQIVQDAARWKVGVERGWISNSPELRDAIDAAIAAQPE